MSDLDYTKVEDKEAEKLTKEYKPSKGAYTVEKEGTGDGEVSNPVMFSDRVKDMDIETYKKTLDEMHDSLNSEGDLDNKRLMQKDIVENKRQIVIVEKIFKDTDVTGCR